MNDNSGPAFPGQQGHIPDGTWNQTWESGFTKREYFAIKAMGALIIAKETNTLASDAVFAVLAADALIAELKK